MFLPIRRYADIDLCQYADIADTDTTGKGSFIVSAYRQHFPIADTDTADTEKCADMPIFPILVSAHPYYRPPQSNSHTGITV